MSLAEQDRNRRLKALALWCVAEFTGIEPDDSMLEELGFGSLEAWRIQLGNWDVPRWVTQKGPTGKKVEAPKPAPRERKARGSGLATELPPASNAAPLFRGKLEVLALAVEDLKHRKEKLQGGRFVQSAVHWDPIYVSRDLVSEEQWQRIREHFRLDPEAKEHTHFGGTSFLLGAGTPVPQAPLPALIGAYLLTGGDVELLVEALHPDPASADWVGIEKRIEGRKGGPEKLDGLKALAEQLAKAIRGGTLRAGSPAAELSPHEINLASRITERRDAHVPDEQIYEELRQLPRLEVELTWKEFHRLANLGLRFPWT
jgi:hypothetical protein